VRASTWKQVRLGGQVSTASGLARPREGTI